MKNTDDITTLTSSDYKAIAVPVAELEAVSKWAGTASNSPHLHIVAFRDGEYTACDGHRLVRVPCVTQGHSFGIERSHVATAIAAHRAQGHGRREIDLRPLSEQWIAVHIGPGSDPSSLRFVVPRRKLDKYPTTEALDNLMSGVRQTPSLEGHAFDPKYLAAIAEVHAADYNAAENHSVKVVAWAADRCGGVLFRSGKGVRFLVMPVRS